MAPYFVTIVLTAMFAAGAQIARSRYVPERKLPQNKQPFHVRALLFLAVLPLILTAGLRYNVGTDFGAYYNAEEIFGGHLWNSVRELNEPGLPLLVEIIGWFSHDGGVYIFVFSLLTVGFSTYAILKHSDDYLFALLLYVFCGIWHGSFNGVRQYLAATILLLGHRYILDRKLWKYTLTVVLAFCFHSSAIIMMIPYFVLRNRIRGRNILLLVLGTVLVSMNYETVFRFIGMLKEREVVMDSYVTSSVNLLRVLANIAPAALALFLFRHKEPNEEETFYINGLIINGAAMVAASNSTYLARVGIYTGIFLPLALPRLIHTENKRLEAILRLGTTLLFAVFWYYEVSTYPSLNQFTWVFGQ